MNIKTIFRISLMRIKQNKKENLIVLIPIIITVIFLLFANMIRYSISSYLQDMERNIKLRTISSINYNEQDYEAIFEKLKTIKHIDMVVNQYERNIVATMYSRQLKTANADGSIYEMPINEKTCPDVVLGRKIKDDDKYVVIIPDKIFSDGAYRNFDDFIPDDEFIDGKQLLNTDLEIEMKYENKVINKIFKVVGVYDSQKYSDLHTLYMPKETIKEINQEIGYQFKDFYIDIVVDKLSNLKDVKNKLIENNILKMSNIQSEANKEEIQNDIKSNFYDVTNINVETQNIIQNTLVFLLLASIITSVVLLLITTINKMYMLKQDIAILKIEGYKNFDINKIIILENICVCIIGFILGIIFYKVLQLIGNFIMDYIINYDTVSLSFNNIREELYYLRKIPQKIDINLISISFIIITVLEIIYTYFINKKMLKKNIAEILRQ